MRTLLPLVMLILILSSRRVGAHPVAYQGAFGVMSWNQTFMTDEWLTYSFKPYAAAAGRAMRFDTTDGRVQFFAPQLDLLVKRWNGTDSQSNIYAYGAFGSMNFRDSNAGAGLAGVEADSESRKLFAMLKYEKMWSSLGPDFYNVQARVGLAPYEAEFSEIASWFMIQYQYHPMLTTKYAVTPLVRVFYKNFLFEAGSSFDGDWMTNFMFHF
jgi:hypothetical protein